MEYGNFSNKSENIRYNLKGLNKNNNIDNNKYFYPNKNDISMSFNRKEIMNKYLNNQEKKLKEKGGGFYNYSKKKNNAMKTFLIKDNKDNKDNKDGVIYSMKLNSNKKNIYNNIDKTNFNKDNNKKEIVFPLIYPPDYKINRHKNKNNSTTNKSKKYPELFNNFRKTVNSNNFRNKLTIHDLK